MIYLLYVSSATRLLSEAELIELLQKARTNNARDGITGMLLYRDGNFIQVIEGEESVVLALHEKIVNDPRHTNIITLLKRPLTERMFGDWTMGFRNLNKESEETLPGFSRFLAATQIPENLNQNAERVYKLLLSFRDTMR
jgi:hypothetical protein